MASALVFNIFIRLLSAGYLELFIHPPPLPTLKPPPITKPPVFTPVTKPPIIKEPNKLCWTEWFDRDDPSGTGDWEQLSYLRKENPGKICNDPLDIQAETLTGLSVLDAGEMVTMDKDTGLVCLNENQTDQFCNDYRVRFSCYAPYCAEEEVCWTDWFDRDNPSGTGDWETLNYLQKEDPGKICKNPKYIEAVTVNNSVAATATGQDFIIYNPTEGFVCKNKKGQYCEDYKVRFGCCCD